MKIGILDAVYFNVKIDVDGEYDHLGSNKGYAVTSYTGAGFELAKKMSKENEVVFFSSLGQPLFYVCNILKRYNINTDHITYHEDGLRLEVEFSEEGEYKGKIDGGGSIAGAVDHIKQFENEIFNGMDVMVSPFIYESILELCKKHGVHFFLLSEDDDYSYYVDDSDLRIIRGIKTIAPENAYEVLSKWSKLTKEERKMQYEYNDLAGRWENLIEDIDIFDVSFDYEEMKHLVYDTFHYYKKLLEEKDIFPRDKLLLYKYAGQVNLLLSDHSTPGEEVCNLLDAVDGLCYVIENGYSKEYGNILPLRRHDVEGHGPASEADMTSYESFEKSLDENIKIWREYFEGNE